MAGDLLAGNPHADRLGNPAVWHFFTEPEAAGADAPPPIPAGSLLARWLGEADADRRQQLAAELAALLAAPASTATGPDAELRRQLLAIDGPLAGGLATLRTLPVPSPAADDFGLDPTRFGHGDQPMALPVAAASTVSFRIPAELAAAGLVRGHGQRSQIRRRVLARCSAVSPPEHLQQRCELAAAGPVITSGSDAARAALAAAFAQFRTMFPAALCYAKVVTVDEVITLTLFHRDDEPLRRLLLDEAQTAELDQLWAELHFVAEGRTAARGRVRAAVAVRDAGR